MGKPEPSIRFTTERSDCGQSCGLPTAEVDQSWARIMRAMAESPARKAGGVATSPSDEWGSPALPRQAQALKGTTSWRCSPRPSMPRVITSPFFRYFGGFMPRPTPGGVPVVITSPGSRVMKWLQ